MPKSLISARRLVTKGGKNVTDPTATCKCCDNENNNPAKCSSKCALIPRTAWLEYGATDEGTCCVPRQIYVKLEGTGGGNCFVQYGGGGGSLNVIAWEQRTLGNVDLVGCLPIAGFFGSGGLVGGFSYVGILKANYQLDLYYTTYNKDQQGNDGGPGDVPVVPSNCGSGPGQYWQHQVATLRAAKVNVSFVPPLAPGERWKCYARVEMCDIQPDDLTDGSGFKMFIPGFVPLWASVMELDPTSFLPTFPTADATEVNACQMSIALPFGGDWTFTQSLLDPRPPNDPITLASEYPHFTGGTLTVKPCCEKNEIRDCAGNVTALETWYEGIACNGDGPQDVWARKEWLRFDPDTGRSQAYRYLITGVCLYFDLSASTVLEVDEAHRPDVALWLHSDDPVYDTCALCDPVVGDCPTDNDECDATYTGTFTPGGTCVDVTPKVGTLTPDGDGTWSWQQYPDTEDEFFQMEMWCDEDYYYVGVFDLVEAGGYSITFRKARSGPCPPTGEYDYFNSDSSAGACSLIGSTFSLA